MLSSPCFVFSVNDVSHRYLRIHRRHRFYHNEEHIQYQSIHTDKALHGVLIVAFVSGNVIVDL